MSDVAKGRASDPHMVVIDREYFRGQVKEALSTFMAPLSGVYGAAVGADGDVAERAAAKQK